MKKLLLMAILLIIASGYTSAHCCTAFFASEGDTVLVGNNEDFISIPTKVWIFPKEKGKLGRIYFGFKDIPNIPMGGMNEGGLFFDCFSTPPLEVKLSKNKEKYNGFLMTKIMEECDTVKKALEMLSKYNLEYMRTHQTFIVDKTGDWAIVEGDAIINLKEELMMGQHSYDIPSLFPKTIAGDRFLDECKKQKATAREIIQALEKGL